MDFGELVVAIAKILDRLAGHVAGPLDVLSKICYG